jgi:hypothetical protein
MLEMGNSIFSFYSFNRISTVYLNKLLRRDNMNKQWFSRQAITILSLIILIGLIFNPELTVNSAAEVYADEHSTYSFPPQNTGPVLVVTNTNMEENGSYWDPFLLIENPGPDGISYAEAIHAVGADNGLHETITFDPSLSGAVIYTSQGYNNAPTADSLTIDGDLDDDGDPDITLDGGNGDGNGIWLWATSHVLIEGLIIRNYGWGGIRITNNIEQPDLKVFEDIVIRNNRISGIGDKGAIEITLENVDNGAIRGIEIVDNTILDDSLGVDIEASWGGNSYDEISHIYIISNTITGGVTIRAAGGLQNGASHNMISDVMISGNQISEPGILMDAANRADCNNNTIRDVTISDNRFDSMPVGIEIVSVGENGWNANGNLVENMVIADNVFTGGGIQISGANGGNSNNNTMSGIMIDRNQITSCAANGIYLIAGSGGSHHNLIENTIIRNSVVSNCASGAGVLLTGSDDSGPNNTINGVNIVNLTLVENGINSAWAGGLNINSLNPVNIISGVTISNTILWDNNFDDAILGSEVPDSVAYSILNDVRFTGIKDNFYEPPEFVNPPAWDYRLQASSPGVDTGDPLGLHTGVIDLDKMIRVWDGNGDLTSIVDRGAFEYGSIQPQEIDVQGNMLIIRNGDTVPGYWDDTDFGLASINSGTVEHTFTIKNIGDLPLLLTGDPKVAIIGDQATDFSVTTQPQASIDPDGSTTFIVSFIPTQNGLRNAIISISSDDGDENPYTFAIKGTGIRESVKFYLPIVSR